MKFRVRVSNAMKMMNCISYRKIKCIYDKAQRSNCYKERNHSAKICHKNVQIIWKLKFPYIMSEEEKTKRRMRLMEKEMITLSLNIRDGNNKGLFSND